MKAHLYIARQSFDCTGMSPDEFKRKIDEFCQMVDYSLKGSSEADNDYIVCKPEFMDCVIFNGLTINDVMCFTENARSILGYDLLTNFITAISKFKDSTENKTLDNLPQSTNDDDYAICVFRPVEEFPNVRQVISNVRELGKFRCRHFIDFPNSDSYFVEADKYMSGLCLHPNIKNSYKKVFSTHKRKIDVCLWTMDEHYLNYFKDFHGNVIECVGCFAKEYKLFEGGSYEGSAKLKGEKLCFVSRKDGVYCEPHIKMNYDDREKRNYCRIYFEEPRHGMNKVYIGFICEHK